MGTPELSSFREVLTHWDPKNTAFPEELDKNQLKSLRLLNQLLQTEKIDAGKIKKLVTHLRDGYLEKYDSKWMHPVDGILTIFGKKTEKDEFLELSSQLEKTAAARSSVITRLAQAGFQVLQGVYSDLRGSLDVTGHQAVVDEINGEISQLSAKYDKENPSQADAVAKVHGLSSVLTSISEDFAPGGALEGESSDFRNVVGAGAIKMGEVLSDDYKKNIANNVFRIGQGLKLMFTGKTDDDRVRIACKNIARQASQTGSGVKGLQPQRVHDYFNSKLAEIGVTVTTESVAPTAQKRKGYSPEYTKIAERYQKKSK
jgi:hypothetical protein